MDKTIKFDEYTSVRLYEKGQMYGINVDMFKGIAYTKKILVQTIGKRTAYVYNYHKDVIVSSYVLRRPFRLTW